MQIFIKGLIWMTVSRNSNIFHLEQSSLRQEDSLMLYSTKHTVDTSLAYALWKTSVAYPYSLLPQHSPDLYPGRPGKKKGLHFRLFPSSRCRSKTIFWSDMLVGGFCGSLRRFLKHTDPVFPLSSSSSGSHLDCEMTLRIENSCGGLPVMETKPPMQQDWQVELNERRPERRLCPHKWIAVHYRGSEFIIDDRVSSPFLCLARPLPFHRGMPHQEGPCQILVLLSQTSPEPLTNKFLVCYKSPSVYYSVIAARNGWRCHPWGW